MAKKNTPMNSSTSKQLETDESRLENALKDLSEIDKDLFIFDDKKINITYVFIIKQIDFENQKFEGLRMLNHKAISVKVSFKQSAFNTQIENLSVKIDDIISVKYLGQKVYNETTYKSFIVKKLQITSDYEGKEIQSWITSKQALQ